MTDLVEPDVAWHRSWADAVMEFGDQTIHGSGFWRMPRGRFDDLTLEGCRQVVTNLRAALDPEPGAEHVPGSELVPDSLLWIVDGDPAEVVGFLSLRHRLNAWLLEEGGHIGYSIRPSRRRQGHATRALTLAVRRAAGLGIERVLVTCEENNVPSALTIERAGGVYEDSRNGKRRYWIETT